MVDKNISEIIELLRKENPHVRIALLHSNPLELLIATILSAADTSWTKCLQCKKAFVHRLCLERALPVCFYFRVR